MVYQETKRDGDEESASNGNGSEIEIIEMAGERLSDDGDGEHGETAEDGRSSNVP
jgi:hypothetical protein